MKKLVLTSLFTLLASATGTAQKSTWGPWSTVSGYPKLFVSSKRSHFNRSAKKWHWKVRFENRYSDTINFSYRVGERTSRAPRLNQRAAIRSGRRAGSYALLRTNSGVRVWVAKVTYGGRALFGQPYAKPYETPEQYRRRIAAEKSRRQRPRRGTKPTPRRSSRSTGSRPRTDSVRQRIARSRAERQRAMQVLERRMREIRSRCRKVPRKTFRFPTPSNPSGLRGNSIRRSTDAAMRRLEAMRRQFAGRR